MKRLAAFLILMTCGVSILAQESPRVELFAAYSYSNIAAQQRHGFNGAQGALKFNFTPQLGILADGGGQYRSDPSFIPPPNLSFFNFHDRYLHVYEAFGGPEFTQRNSRLDTFEHALAGIVHGASRVHGENFPGFALGGGVALHGNRGPSLRIQADYIHDYGGGQWFNDIRLGAGILFKIVN